MGGVIVITRYPNRFTLRSGFRSGLKKKFFFRFSSAFRFTKNIGFWFGSGLEP
jgi:hypothetical protein